MAIKAPSDPDDLPPPAEDCHDPADDLLAVALAAGREVAQAATDANVSERTAYRRLADADFRKRVNELRAAMVDRASGRLADSMADAATELRALLGSADERIRLAAAKGILETTIKVREATEVEARLLILEAAALDNEKANARRR